MTQNHPSQDPEIAASDRKVYAANIEYGQILRRQHRDYDRWTVADMSKYHDRDIQFLRNVMTRDGLEWRSIIPRSIVREWGDEAPAAFARRIHEVVRERGLDGQLFAPMMAPIYAHAGRLPVESVDIPGGFRVSTAKRTADLTPGQVVNYAITTEAALEGGSTVVVPLPPSVNREVLRINPDLGRAIKARGGDGEIGFTANPALVYDAARVAARGYVRDIDYPRPDRITDLPRLCNDLRAAEREIYNTSRNDVDGKLVVEAATYRETTNCPVIRPQVPRIAPTARELRGQ